MAKTRLKLAKLKYFIYIAFLELIKELQTCILNIYGRLCSIAAVVH